MSFIIGVYFVVACLGIYLLFKLFSKTPPKFIIGIIHGAVALFGIGALIFYISMAKGDTPYMSVFFFVIALCIGGGMLATTMLKKKFPKWIAFIHIAFALAGIIVLYKFWINTL